MAGELEKLMEGNRRFVSGKLLQKDLVARRAELVSGQKPFAIVLTCSDSRVAPEYIFDATLGELFVIRTAGNIVDSIALGSIEYAAEHLGSPLLLVLGHEKCGAVAAACAGGKPEGNISSIVSEIAPAAKAMNNDPGKTVPENVKRVLAKIRKKSQILSHLEREGKLKLAGGFYLLSSGEVKLL